MKTLDELRDALLQTVEDVRDKKMGADEANAVSKAAQSVINLTRLQLDYMSVKGERDEQVDFFDKTKKLETDNGNS